MSAVQPKGKTSQVSPSSSPRRARRLVQKNFFNYISINKSNNSCSSSGSSSGNSNSSSSSCCNDSSSNSSSSGSSSNSHNLDNISSTNNHFNSAEGWNNDSSSSNSGSPIPTTPLTAPSVSGDGGNEVSNRGNTGYLPPPPTSQQPIKTSQQPLKNFFSTNKSKNPPSPSQSAIKDRIDLLSEQQTPDNNSLPSLHQIPCPSIVTFNPTSLSHYTGNQNKINKTLTKFSNKYDVIFLQETKLLAREGQALKTILSGQ